MNLKERLFSISATYPNFRIWLACFLVAGFIAYYWDQKAPRGATSIDAQSRPEEVSTLIPEGYVLVPIEVANYESLDSILGQFGVVDLYIPNENTRKPPIKIAERIKILRAPLNPSRFAVLAPESQSSKIVSIPGEIHVVVQNPSRRSNTIGTKIENQLSRNTGIEKERQKKFTQTRIHVETHYVDSEN